MLKKNSNILSGTVSEVSHSLIVIIGGDRDMYLVHRKEQPEFNNHKWKLGVQVTIVWEESEDKEGRAYKKVTAVYPPDQCKYEEIEEFNESLDKAL